MSALHLSLPPCFCWVPLSHCPKTGAPPRLPCSPPQPGSHQLAVHPTPSFPPHDRSTGAPPLPPGFLCGCIMGFHPPKGTPLSFPPSTPIQLSRIPQPRLTPRSSALRTPDLWPPGPQPGGLWLIHGPLVGQGPHPASFPCPPSPAIHSPPSS